MGVIYKLTPSISTFIIEQKKSSPKASCQSIADHVYAAFGQRVSKSSVHELLKQSKIITPRNRLVKEKFQIPAEKKIQISKDIEAMLLPNIPPAPTQTVKIDPPAQRIKETQPPALPEPQRPELSAAPIDESKPPIALPGPMSDEEKSIHQQEIQQEATGRIFLDCALWDISFKPILGIKDSNDLSIAQGPKAKMEWEYLLQPIEAIRLEIDDEKVLFIDGRFQGVSLQAPGQTPLSVAIERAACEGVDYLLNNVQPLIIQEIPLGLTQTALPVLAQAMGGEIGGNLRKMALVNAKGQQVIEFNTPLPQKRRFIAGIAAHDPAIADMISQDEKEKVFESPLKDARGKPMVLKACKTNQGIIITNMVSDSYDQLLALYHRRFPSHTKAKLTAIAPRKLPLDQPFDLARELMYRARMFFPDQMNPQAIEQILALNAKSAKGTDFLRVSLQIPTGFSYGEELKAAIKNVNHLFIKDYQGRIVRLGDE